MDIKEAIQHYILSYNGSEKRVIENTTHVCNCKESDVKACIDWLIKYGYVKEIPLNEMTDCEKTFFNSDCCTILRNIESYNEIKHYQKMNEEKEKVDKLSNIEKFKYYFSKMENEFKRVHLLNENEKNYSLSYKRNKVIIAFNDGNESVCIDFDKISNLEFIESQNYIFYKLDEIYYYIELRSLHHDWNLMNYKAN